MASLTIYLNGLPLHNDDGTFAGRSTYGMQCTCPVPIYDFKGGRRVGAAIICEKVVLGGIEYLEFECEIETAHVQLVQERDGRLTFSGVRGAAWKGIHLLELYLGAPSGEITYPTDAP